MWSFTILSFSLVSRTNRRQDRSRPIMPILRRSRRIASGCQVSSEIADLLPDGRKRLGERSGHQSVRHTWLCTAWYRGVSPLPQRSERASAVGKPEAVRSARGLTTTSAPEPASTWHTRSEPNRSRADVLMCRFTVVPSSGTTTTTTTIVSP